MSSWCFSHSDEIFVYLSICSLRFCIQVLKGEAFITFYCKTPGIAPEGQSTLRASTLQGCGPDTETRMNDMWHVESFVVDETSLHHFTRGPYVSGGLAAVTGQQPDQRRLDGPAIPSYKFSLFSRWTFFWGFRCLWCRWLVGSCEMMKRKGLKDSTRIAMCPCFHVSKRWWESLWGRQSQMVQVRCCKNNLQFVCDLCSKLHGNWYWYGAC